MLKDSQHGSTNGGKKGGKNMRFLMQSLAPQRVLSIFAGMLAESRVVWLKNMLIRYFLGKFKINMAEAVDSDPYAYASFNELFTRHLQLTAREIASAKDLLVSPADGTIAQLGYLQNDLILQAKGKNFKLPELLGGDVIDATIFNGGAFATIYLAPPDYHRVHMPMTGQLLQMVYVPGRLFSVNKATTDAIPDLFGRNERVISIFATEHGKMAVILVGAMLVGSINTAWAGTINPKHKVPLLSKHYPSTLDQQILLHKGEELGHFKMGSTAIVLMERDRVVWNNALAVGSKVQFGQAIGTIV